MAHTLITGGAGFIGAHLAARLLHQGDEVRLLDSLLPQVHGETQRPDYLPADAELVVADVRDADAVRRALRDIDRVVHLTARVGVGQSMYEIVDYTSVNVVGTSVLLQALLDHPVERLVVASSMSVYGEGLYLGPDGRPLSTVGRTREQLQGGRWEPVGPAGEALSPVPTPETKPPSLSSVYALTKFDQERLCLLFGEAYNVPTLALRFFNVYGPYQALSNPYTGVLAIFASRLLNGRSPLIFEDGEQRRDFVSVHDDAGPARWRCRSKGGTGTSSTSAAAKVCPSTRSPDASAASSGTRRWSRRSPGNTASATYATASPTSPWPRRCSATARRSTSTKE